MFATITTSVPTPYDFHHFPADLRQGVTNIDVHRLPSTRIPLAQGQEVLKSLLSSGFCPPTTQSHIPFGVAERELGATQSLSPLKGNARAISSCYKEALGRVKASCNILCIGNLTVPRNILRIVIQRSCSLQRPSSHYSIPPICPLHLLTFFCAPFCVSGIDMYWLLNVV